MTLPRPIRLSLVIASTLWITFIAYRTALDVIKVHNVIHSVELRCKTCAATGDIMRLNLVMPLEGFAIFGVAPLLIAWGTYVLTLKVAATLSKPRMYN